MSLDPRVRRLWGSIPYVSTYAAKVGHVHRVKQVLHGLAVFRALSGRSFTDAAAIRMLGAVPWALQARACHVPAMSRSGATRRPTHNHTQRPRFRPRLTERLVCACSMGVYRCATMPNKQQAAGPDVPSFLFSRAVHGSVTLQSHVGAWVCIVLRPFRAHLLKEKCHTRCAHACSHGVYATIR